MTTATHEINALSDINNIPAPLAKNPALQEEINKANTLFNRLSGEIAELHQAMKNLKNELETFVMSLSPPLSPEQTAVFQTFIARDATLKAKQTQYNADSLNIKHFIQILSADENPSADIRNNFWAWADARFSASTLTATS